jgi:transposase
VARIMIEFGVISLAPVPVDDGIFVEGGGLRAWYLSRSINELGSKVALIAPNKLRRFRQINPTMQYREYEDFSEIHELVADCKVSNICRSRQVSEFKQDPHCGCLRSESH